MLFNSKIISVAFGNPFDFSDVFRVFSIDPFDLCEIFLSGRLDVMELMLFPENPVNDAELPVVVHCVACLVECTAPDGLPSECLAHSEEVVVPFGYL